MPAYVRFYGLTPAEFYALTLDDFEALAGYRAEALRAMERAGGE